MSSAIKHFNTAGRMKYFESYNMGLSFNTAGIVKFAIVGLSLLSTWPGEYLIFQLLKSIYYVNFVYIWQLLEVEVKRTGISA